MPAPTITPLPTPPSRSTDPTNFAIEADAFVAALPDFATEANAQADYLDALAIAVDADAAIAQASASIATGAANYQGDYNAGTTYQIGESVSYSGRRYVAKTVNTGVTPVDGANWLIINDGDVSGPASATANGIALYDGTTGKIIKAGPAPSTAGNLLTSDGTTWQSIAPPSNIVNYPQNIKSANYTLVLSDAGKQIFHPASDATARVYTIPSNASVAFPIGTVVLFTAENGGPNIAVGINSDTLINGSGLTGIVTVPKNNTLMAVKVTATKWMANLLYQTGTPGTPYQIALSTDATGIYLDVYNWNSTSGFGSRYANPGTIPTGPAYAVAFSPANNAIAFAHATTPFVTAYPWSGSGFGTKYANPATLPAGQGSGVAFSPTAGAIAIAHNTSPFISAYPWNASTGFGTKYANPTTLPSGNPNIGNSVAFSPAGNAVAVTSGGGTPFIHAYAWSDATGFGTKYANPATLPTNAAYGVKFSPAGDAIATVGNTSPTITAYPWNASTGFGTKYANPATLPGFAIGVAFSPAGNAIAVADQISPYIIAYPWSVAGFGTKYTNPATLPTGGAYGVGFSPAGDAIAVGISSTPYVTAYPWDASTGFGAKYANPGTLPAGGVTDVAFATAP